MLTGFVEVAELHGEEAAEVIALRQLWNHHRQSLFPFMEEEKSKRQKVEKSKRGQEKVKTSKRQNGKTAERVGWRQRRRKRRKVEKSKRRKAKGV